MTRTLVSKYVYNDLSPPIRRVSHHSSEIFKQDYVPTRSRIIELHFFLSFGAVKTLITQLNMDSVFILNANVFNLLLLRSLLTYILHI